LDGPQQQDELVRRAQRRDAEAFAALVRQFERAALAVGLAGTGDGDAAGDVVQDAFVRAWERLADLREPRRFGPWLVGIVRNLAADHRRRAARRHSEPLGDGPTLGPTCDPADEASRREVRLSVVAALDELDEVSRSAVVLRYYDGMSSREIGHLLELSPAAVDMRLMRARDQLRERLQRDVMTDDEQAECPETAQGAERA
jgi:RNA polymerase sigma factor (sigma-70 family)